MADGISCDRCQKSLLVDENVRYVADLRVYAAYDPLEMTRDDLMRNPRPDIDALAAELAKRDAGELMDEVARVFKLDLCPPCQKELLRWLRGGTPAEGL